MPAREGCPEKVLAIQDALEALEGRWNADPSLLSAGNKPTFPSPDSFSYNMERFGYTRRLYISEFCAGKK